MQQNIDKYDPPNLEGCSTEIVGHHEAWLRNTTQDDPVIEEAQASIRGALFGVGLSNEERQLLMQDASERLAKVGKTIEDVEDLIDIKER